MIFLPESPIAVLFRGESPEKWGRTGAVSVGEGFSFDNKCSLAI